MIVSLGVDYSIFLMMRYNETAQGGLKEIIPTSLQMGSVILGAAVILGGTFVALMPSGVITLIQVAMAVIIGLVILTFMMMPIFIPAWFGLADKIKLLLANRKEKISNVHLFFKNRKNTIIGIENVDLVFSKSTFLARAYSK